MSFETEIKATEQPQIPELYEVRGNGYVWRYTSYKNDLSFQGKTYKASTIKRGAFNRTSSAGDSKVSISFPVAAPIKEHIASYPIQNVWVKIFQAIDPAMTSYALLFEGKIKKVSLQGKIITAECGIDDDLSQMLPHIVYQSYCNWTVFDRNCGLEDNAWAVTAAITGQTDGGMYIVSPVFATYENGWFTQGRVVYDGDARFAIWHEGSTVCLQVPFTAGAGVVGNSVTAYPGCDGNPSTCKTKFNNFLLRHVSMPYIPCNNPVLWGFK
jgi:uncharacterized phage protein (TIGR02218 family)